MNFEIKEIILLNDGKEYIVGSKAEYKNDLYYFFIDYENKKTVKYFKESPEISDKLIEINDQKIIKILLPLFAVNADDVFKDTLEKLNSY